MTATIYGQNAPSFPVANPNSWVRPQFWRALPAITAADEKVVGLFAVGPAGTGNVVAFTCAGNYTVDWGDGVTENINSGVQANHEYDFADADLANTDAPVTITAATGIFTRVGHGFGNGDVIHFFRIQTTTGISENVTYWVINATPNTFQVSASKGGAAVALTGDGSAALSPYKQAIITITPQGGAQLTSVNFNVKHSSLSGATTIAYGWLDLALSLPNCSASGLTISTASPTIYMFMLQQVVIRNTGALTSMANLFRTMAAALRSVSISGCNAVTNMSYLFNGCSSLTNVQLLNTSSVTDVSYMLQNCTSLQVAPMFDTSAVTTAPYMFGGCSALQTVPQYNFSSLTVGQNMFRTCLALASINLQTSFGVSCDLSQLFRDCYTLSSVVMPNTDNVANMSLMFYNCQSLTSVTLPKTQSVTDMNTMFYQCFSLVSISLPTTGSVTNMNSMFVGCSSLQSVYLPNTGKVTDMSAMFQYCYGLPTAPPLNTASVTAFNQMFQACYLLQSVPLYNMASCTNASSMFSGCISLRSVPAFVIGGVNANLGFMFNGCTSLQSVGAMVTSTATSFTSMFANCYSLQSVPVLDASLVTTLTSMFANCYSLQSVPALNTPLVTSFNNMFSGCSSLQYVPTYNTASATNMGGMFQSCYSLTYAPPFASTSLVTTYANTFSGSNQLRAPANYSTAAATTVNGMYPASQVSVPAHNLAATNAANNANILATPNVTSQFLPTGMTRSFTVANHHLSKSALETVFGNLGVANAATLTVTNNPGVDAAVSKTSLATTAKSTTINVADTSNLTTGMFLTNSTIWAAVNFTADVTANTLTLAGHGLVDGTLVSFSSLGTVTGVSTYTPYYVVNAAADTFQIALTAGGAAIDLTGSNGTMAVLWRSKIASINPNVSITLDAPAPTTQTGQTISFRLLDATRALLRGWAITY